MLSITVEQDKFVKQQGKKKPFTTSSAYIRAVIQADYDNYRARSFPQDKKSKR